ncbi:hypothetical protein SVAN01_01225 [Stagonosporopsis vannaccii]|nr:hypothetical protein SVAN01_01225 [Stagonosporopsis vannaccii]
MTPLAMASPAYEGPKALGFSKYANPVQRDAQLAAASSAPASAPSTSDTTIATKEQIAALDYTHELTTPAAELAVEQGIALQKEVQDHTAHLSRAMSCAVTNTRRLLNLLRGSTPSSEEVDALWQELEKLFEAANNAKAALPEFMEKQRDNMSLYHSSMINETIRETQEELQFQHKKVHTQHSLILEQQDAFHNYKAQTASKLKELEDLHERVSRLTLEKGNFRTEVDKYKALLERETAKQAEELTTANAVQKELEMLMSSQKQLQAENETLRKNIADMLEQLEGAEQRVTERFAKEIAARVEELQKESAKTAALNAMINTLKSGESAAKKELNKVNTEYRLLSAKYSNQSSEHAAAFTKNKEQTQKIEALTADVHRLQKQNADLQSEMEDAAELAKAKAELSKAKEVMSNHVDSLALQVTAAGDDKKVLQQELQKLKLELAKKDATPAVSNDKAIIEKVRTLEVKNNSLEASLQEWTELAKRSYKEYKDMLPKCKEAEKYQKDVQEKQLQIDDLQKQLASAKATPSNGVSAATVSDTAYWKQKYETLLSSL